MDSSEVFRKTHKVKEKESADELRSKSPCQLSLRLQELLKAPLELSDTNRSGCSVYPVCRTDWMEILLVRFVSDPSLLKIEIEISMPTAEMAGERRARPEKLPSDMIAHMEYLEKLLDVGFSLQVVGEECLWIASKNFVGFPSSDIVELLLPPSLE